MEQQSLLPKSGGGDTTSINQTTQKASINWQTFSIAKNETVTFNQPNTSSITLNRVIGNESSIIDGALNATGKIFLLNSNGILFTKGSSVNTSGLIASTLNLSDEDFNNDHFVFQSNGTSGSVVNMGTITIANNGYAALLGQEVSNQGVIIATKGTVALASGDKITLNFNGDSLLNVTIDEGTLNALVENKNAIYADGGKVILTAKAANDLLSSQVNNTGLIQAQTLEDLKGEITLYAHGGTTSVDGTLDASAPTFGDGGFIETSGDKVTLADSTNITTKATLGKSGTWLIDPDGFTIAAYGGDITGSTLSLELANTSVSIRSTQGSSNDGDINVNDVITWNNPTTLTLNATHDININKSISPTSAQGSISLYAGNDILFNTALVLGYSTLTANAGRNLSVSAPLSWEGSVTLNALNNLELDDILTGTSGTLFLNGNTIAINKNLSLGISALVATATNDLILNAPLSWSGSQNVSLTSTAGNLNLYGTIIGTNGTLNLTSTIGDVEMDGLVLLGATTTNVTAGDDINLNASLSWSGDTIATLRAGNYININAPLSATGTHAGLVMTYGTDYTIFTKANYSGAVINADGIAVAQIAPEDAVYGAITLNGANASLSMGGNTYTLIHSMSDLGTISGVDGYYALAQNLDASTQSYTTAVVTNLSGTLAGLGHTVDKLTISAASSDDIGLIGIAASNAKIRDIGVTNANITGANFVGALVGDTTDALTVTKAYSTGSVIGGTYVGGLIGEIFGDYWNEILVSAISYSYSSANVTSNGDSYTGGLVGYFFGGKITHSHATGSVTSSIGFSGGLVGNLYSEFGLPIETGVDLSYATGAVSNTAVASKYTTYGVGGLIGSAAGNSTITNSFATGAASGYGTVGGLLGYGSGTYIDNTYHTTGVVSSFGYCYLPEANAWSSGTGGLIGALLSSNVANSFSIGDVVSTYNSTNATGIGGLIGYVNGRNSAGADVSMSTVTNSFAVGNVTAQPSSKMVGGLIGNIARGNIDNSWANVSVIGGTDVGGLVGYAYGAATSTLTDVVKITNSTVYGTVSGNTYVGGIVGYSNGQDFVLDSGTNVSGSYIQNSTSYANVSGNDYVGGIAGKGNVVTDSSAHGTVTSSGTNVSDTVVTYRDELASIASSGNTYLLATATPPLTPNTTSIKESSLTQTATTTVNNALATAAQTMAISQAIANSKIGAANIATATAKAAFEQHVDNADLQASSTTSQTMKSNDKQSTDFSKLAQTLTPTSPTSILANVTIIDPSYGANLKTITIDGKTYTTEDDKEDKK